MAKETQTLSRLDAKRREQTPQALARLTVVGLFISLWFVLRLAQMPMPFPFLVVLVAEVLFFLVYWRIVFVLPGVRAVELAHYGMLAAEIVFHTTIVYFLGGISWLGSFAYVFGLVFANTYLDLRRGLIYTIGASLAFTSLIVLEATGAIPHYTYLEQGALRYTDAQFVATTIIGGFGIFLSLHLWMTWVGHQIRQERDGAVRANEGLMEARAALQHANEELEVRVAARAAELEQANHALRESERRLRTVVGNASVVLFALDREGVFTLAEGKGLDDLGIGSDQLVGHSSFDMFPSQPEVHQAIREALAGEDRTTLVINPTVAFEAKLTALRDQGGAIVGVIGVATDITESRRAEALVSGQRDVLELMAVGAPLDQVLEKLVLVLEEQSDEMLCSVCLVAREGDVVQPAAGPSLPPEFTAALASGVPIGPSSGSCGTAVYRSQPVIVTDIATDPLWDDFRDLALGYDLRACWSTPIFSTTGDVLGTFAIYYREPRGPDPRTGQLVEIATRLAGLAIEREQAENALRASEIKFRAMTETIAAATFIFQGTKMRYVNSTAERVTGYSREELLTMNFWEVIHPDFRELVRDRGLARQRGENVPAEYEVKIQTKSGEERWFHFAAGAVEFEGKPSVLGTAFDITERKRAEDLLKLAASHDPLTGLLNRRAGLQAIEDRLAAAKESSGRFAVFVLDLDKFKSINDSFSHETGDAALVEFSEVMLELVGDRGTICRMGGDEFEIGLDDAGPEQAFEFARQLQHSLERRLADTINESRPHFTVSVGIACYPGEGESIEILGRHADQAMYAGKAAGGDAIRAWHDLDATQAA